MIDLQHIHEGNEGMVGILAGGRAEDADKAK